MSLPSTESEAAENEQGTAERGARTRGWSGTRLVALIAGVAVVSLLLGVVIMQFIVSPGDLAARTEPPEAGLITAPVEQRVIQNTVTTRGEVTYADAVEVTIDTAGIGERPVVTGQVPEVGRVLNAGEVALEVAGRPVIVLSGDLPVYRSLSVGMRGPDVAQVKAALQSLGVSAGNLENDVFEADTAWGLGALYERSGYAPQTGGEQTQQALRSAERAVRDANVAVAQARAALNQAREAGATDLSSEQAQLNAAGDAWDDANELLAEAQVAIMPSLPASEVLFLGGLPRRVDDVRVKRGDILQGAAMTVSGAALTIRGSAAQQDVQLLREGLTATFPGPDGTDLTATVVRIEAPQSNSGSGQQREGGNADGAQQSAARYTVVLDPGELSSAQIEALRGTNVRVQIPVDSTDGEVLAVPIAALTSGSGGDSRVELVLDAPENGQNTAIIEVQTGLAADGYVQVSSEDARLTVGAQIVVGR